RAHRCTHLFPTRRSSDLAVRAAPLDARRRFVDGPGAWRQEQGQEPQRQAAPGHGLPSAAQDPQIVLKERSYWALMSVLPEIVDEDRKSTRLNSSHVAISY